MSFFDNLFGNNTQSSAPATGDVVIAIGAETVQVSAEQAAGKTISQLFDEFSEALGVSSDRINRYVDAGTIVPGDQAAQAGHVYRGTVTTESKAC